MKGIRQLVLILILSNCQFVFSQTTVVYNSTTSTLNGKPFFVKGIYTGGGADLGKMRETGFNVVMNYATRDMDESQALTFLDDAENHDLYVLFHFNKSCIVNGCISPRMVR